MEKLKGKKKREVLEALKDYGIEKDIKDIYCDNSSIYILTPKAAELFDYINKSNIKCRAGFYLGKIEKEGFRLSFDACQLFSNKIKKYMEVNEDQAKKWFKGEDIKVIEKEKKGFFILRFKEDFIGCGLLKDGKIKNYVPKDRREK